MERLVMSLAFFAAVFVFPCVVSLENRTLVEDKDFRVRVVRSDFEEIEKHEFKEDICGSTLREVLQENRCKPRPTVVKLEPIDQYLQMNPSTLTVNRCGGSCSSKKSCLPTAAKDITVDVKPLHALRRMYLCGQVKILEHTQCTCKCSQMEHHCTEKQMYDARNCMCVCKDPMERMRCINRKKVWDEKRCKCMCAEERDCSTGLEWIPSRCGCGLVTMMEENDVDY